MFKNALHVFKRKMEVATQTELQGGTNFLPKLIEQIGEVLAIVGIAIISVGSGNGVRDAVRNCHAAHFHSYVPGFGAIVNFRQNVAVDIDHEDSSQTLFKYGRMALDRSGYHRLEHILHRRCRPSGLAFRASLARIIASKHASKLQAVFKRRDGGLVASSSHLVHDREHDIFHLHPDYEEQVSQ
jgi:hypothetical protein